MSPVPEINPYVWAEITDYDLDLWHRRLAGFVPPEVELRRELHAASRSVAEARDDTARVAVALGAGAVTLALIGATTG